MISKFFNFKDKKEKYITSVIDDEISNSLKFGLSILKDDIKKEKYVFVLIFKEFWDDIKDSDNKSYSILRQEISKSIFKSLSNQCEYYYNNSKNTEVRNMYQCHLTSVLNRLFLEISNI